MFDKLRKGIHDWGYDTDGVNARRKEAITLILPSLEKIDQIWNESLVKERYITEELHTKGKIYMLGGNDELIKLHETGEIINLQKKYEEKGIDQNNSYLLALNKLIINLNLGIKNDVKELIKCLDELTKIKMLSSFSRQNLYSENYYIIYNEVISIVAYQTKFLDIKQYIGEPINVDAILGQNGIKLKNKDPEALRYVDYLLDLLINLKTQLSFIEARRISKEKRYKGLI